MLLSENLLEIWVDAHKTSPKIAGQLLFYNKTKNLAQPFSENKSTKKGFKFRMIFLQAIMASVLLRILDLKLQSNLDTKTVEINLCLMMLFMCGLLSEGYRIWAYYPNVFLSFFNNLISFERKHCQSSRIRASTTWIVAKHVCRVTRFICKWIFSVVITISCVLDSNMPFNVAWLLSRILGLTKCSSLMSKAFHVGLSLLLNYCNWTMMATRGYLIVTDMLIGTLSLTYFQEVATR